MKNVSPHFTIMVLLLGSLLLVPGPALAETISFPLQIDYPFLKTLVIHSAFTDPGQTMIITDPVNDCQRISLSNPCFSSENNLLRVEAAVHLKGGALMGGNCLFPMEWDGYLVVYMKPGINPDNWQLSLNPVNSVLLDRNHRPDKSLVGNLWNLFKAPVMARMGNICIEVNEPIAELKPFLISAVPEADSSRVIAMVESLRPGIVAAEANAMKIQILADIETLAVTSEPSTPAALMPGEIDAFIKICETWDSFLVQTLMSLIDMPLTIEERETLMTVLLDTRYRFVSEFEAKAPTSSGDFVREQFVDAWERLSPILKKHLARDMSANSWGFLTFFAASDALAALDKLGPVFNIEISENGFIRLARMLSENKALTLKYNQLLDPDLRKLLGMEPSLEIIDPALNEDLLEQEDTKAQPETGSFPMLMDARQTIMSGLYKILMPGICWAGKSWSHPSLKEMRVWLVSKDNVDTHLKKSKILLEVATRKILKKDNIPKNHHQMFQKAVYATAWQESCFRQFIVDKKKLTYIRSYNNTSVGMMQIHERVWRGIYNIERLRWDISYNAAVGVDILNLYLKKYALPKMKSLKGKDVLDSDSVACSLYAMYNAGPGGFSKYVKRRSTGKFSKIDKHFKEKYTWVKKGQWDRLKDCY
ncbi:MAG: lytic transglycosylase domain-containing protein [Desulfobacteraceae bacterium]|jgi:hypothetical protein|nr:lytic transglycosylase domain-containing protein [Desulfobacteraceae bacterium]